VNILLARPKPDSRSVNVQRFMIPEPLELEIVAAHLRNLGHDVALVDLVLERRPLRWFVSRKRYDIVGFTAYINHVQVVKHLARDVKLVSPSTQVVVGGIHAECVPTDFVDASIDHIVWANGVITMGEIASGMSAAEAACLPGVWGSGKAKPAVEHPQGLMPDRTITAKYRNRYTYIHHERSASLKASYGCEAPCGTFCTHNGSYAERDLDEVMDELAGIAEPHVFIVDDNFLSRPSGIRRFCEALDARGISKRFSAVGHADYVTGHPDDIRLLAEHGFEGLFLGVQSLPRSDLSTEGTRTSVEQVIEAVRVLDEVGVQCYSDLFTGEDWGRADFDRLIDFLHQLEPAMVNVQPVTPMPGTRHYDDEREHLSLSRHRSELWDNAHLAFSPTELPVRAYYWNLLRAHYKTTGNLSRRRYVRHRYGKRVYRRMLRGAMGNTWQYLKLMVRPG
jgi:radical SAM superfamily enzyme YgiQ (UPF0313 family)